MHSHLDNLFDPPEITSYCQKTGDISDADAYRAWNMGQGMALVTPEPEQVLAEAKKYGIDARLAGKVTKEPGIRLISKGVEAPGQELTFSHS